MRQVLHRNIISQFVGITAASEGVTRGGMVRETAEVPLILNAAVMQRLVGVYPTTILFVAVKGLRKVIRKNYAALTCPLL